MSKTFKKKHEELIERLIGTGVNKNAAIVLTYILVNEECTQSDIESDTDLRQPEVSVGITELKENGWITKRDVKKDGKGRPYHVYSLDGSIEDVVDDIEEGEKEKISDIKENMSRIKRIVEKLG